MSQQIVGIVLVRNEDIFVRQAVENICRFCDRIFLCDNGSDDHTPDILAELTRKYSHMSLHKLRHPSESHDLLKPLIGSPAWVFGVDGDEIYDPFRLEKFRPQLLSGEFHGIWRMKGHVLHCTRLDRSLHEAEGYAAPPSRSITKLYNFAAISAWDGDTIERLHGGTIQFREGFHDLLKHNFQEKIPWTDSPLCCLHTCFLPRSSRDSTSRTERENITEIYRCGLRGRLARLLRRVFRVRSASQWKQTHYRQGPLVKVPTAPFFHE